MKLSILAENRVKKRGLLAEHGLSVYIESGDGGILFDTGQSDVYCRNAVLMGVDLRKTRRIVLSHGHYDHCGGLICFPEPEKMPPVYVHKAAFARRYAANPDGKTFREIGIPWSPVEYPSIGERLHFTEGVTRIAPGVTLLSEIPRVSGFEEASAGFLAGDERTVDGMRDEQALVIESGEGLAVFLGCSHPGVINCLRCVQKSFPGRKINLLLAGMHLEGASPDRLRFTLRALGEMDIGTLIPLHCTGFAACSGIKRLFGDRCRLLCAGDTWEW